MRLEEMNIKALFFSLGPEVIASCRARVYQYIAYLEKFAINAKVIDYLSLERSICDIKSLRPSLFLKIKSFIFKKVQTLKVLAHAGRYDVIIVHRVLLSVWEQNLLKFVNPRIIFDFVDALYLVPQLEKRFNNMLKISRHLITESKANFRYAQKLNQKVALIATPVDLYRYYPKIQSKEAYPVVIGWIGSSFTVKYLEILKDVFRALKEKYRERIIIKFVGSGELDWNGIHYQRAEWSLNTELGQLQSFDIGVMPLEDNEWCRGKGGYKLLLYMAVGIPCVASPVGINKEIVQDGLNGFLAVSKEEWINRLSVLIENRSLRNKMGPEGRKKAEALYSYQVNVSKLADVIVSIKNGKGRDRE